MWEATTVGREERGEVGVEVERAVRARARPAVVNLRRGANVMHLGQSQRMCKIVCKMLRTIVGWVRISTEDWSDTMRCMREKVDAALKIYPMEPWSSEYLRRQFRMVCLFAKRPHEWAMRVSQWETQGNK